MSAFPYVVWTLGFPVVISEYPDFFGSINGWQAAIVWVVVGLFILVVSE